MNYDQPEQEQSERQKHCNGVHWPQQLLFYKIIDDEEIDNEGGNERRQHQHRSQNGPKPDHPGLMDVPDPISHDSAHQIGSQCADEKN